MKKNLSRVIVPTLAIAIGAAIAGSISGTVAWYQYSTRVNVAYIGQSFGLSDNLEVRLRDADDGKSYSGWKTSLLPAHMADYLSDKNLGQAVEPITFGNMGSDDALPTKSYKNPVRTEEATLPYSGWLEADNSMYVTIPLQLRFRELDNVKTNDEDEAFLERDVYISKLLIQEDHKNKNNADPENDREDLSAAIRVQIHSYRDDDDSVNKVDSTINRLISKDGGTTQTSGHLDLGGEPGIDMHKSGASGAEFGFGDPNDIVETPVVYGEGEQVAYSAKEDIAENVKYYDSEGGELGTEKIYPMVTKTVANSVKLDENDFEYQKEGSSEDFSKSIGHTIASEKGDANEGKYLNVDITIWVEGWQVLPNTETADPDDKAAMWSAEDYIGSMFDVGFQFAVQAE